MPPLLRRLATSTLLFSSAAISSQGQAPVAAVAAQTPEILFFHGNIVTGSHLRADDLGATPDRISALAVSHGIITAIGTDAEILKLKTSKTRVIDLNGAFAMPGFNDAHTHMANAGRQKLSADLTGSRSLAEMQGRIRGYAGKAAPGSWLLGGGWDHTLWPSKQLPSRTDLDAVTAGHPAIFRRVDEHMAVANSAALAAGGISAATPDPAGARIDRDPTGQPTGILREASASALIYAKVPSATLAERRSALTVAIKDALAHGVTTVQDNSDWEDFLALEELERAHQLPIRVAEWLEFNQPLAVLKQRRASHSAGDPNLHLTMLKGFMDGSLGSRTAALEDPYADDPGNSGLPRYDQDDLNHMAAERASAGFQIGLHAIGDRANSMALNAFAAAEQTANPAQTAIPANHPTPPPNPDAAIVTHSSPETTAADLRLRIEHAQVLAPADFERFSSLGVIASMQPSHLITDMAWAEQRLGPDRVKYAYAWRSFLDHGVTLAFGTDYPVESINPFRGLYAAVTRQNEAGTQTFQPQEKITIKEALYAYTQAPAFAEFREHTLGRLDLGFFADMVVLDREPASSSPMDLLHTHVLRTVVNGETVYTAPAQPTSASEPHPASEAPHTTEAPTPKQDRTAPTAETPAEVPR